MTVVIAPSSQLPQDDHPLLGRHENDSIKIQKLRHLPDKKMEFVFLVL